LVYVGLFLDSSHFLFMYDTADASKNGVAREAVNNIRRGKVMTVEEARQVLGLSEHASWEEVLQVNFSLLRFLFMTYSLFLYSLFYFPWLAY